MARLLFASWLTFALGCNQVFKIHQGYLDDGGLIDTSGDTRGSGGIVGTGGSAGAGGSVGAGGRAGSGGLTDGGAGTGGQAGSSVVGSGGSGPPLFDFTSDLQGFSANSWDGDPSCPNLHVAGAGSAVWSASSGNPGGAMKLTATFSGGCGQLVAEKDFSQDQNWAGKKLHVWFKLDSVPNSTLAGVVALQTVVQDATWTITANAWCPLPSNTDWTECVCDMTAVTAAVHIVNVVLRAGSSGTPNGTVSVNVDNITLQ